MKTRRGFATRRALATALAFAAANANAATLNVDCDQGNTINGALAKVAPGDTILVSGTCKEQVNIAQVCCARVV